MPFDMNENLSPNNGETPKPNEIMFVLPEEIPRTQKQRKKNWKCVFPNCNEPVKTRFNCYAHVWDAHLRQFYTQNYPYMYPNSSFKKTQNRAAMKNLCEKHMVQLVESTVQNSHQPKTLQEPNVISKGNNENQFDLDMKTKSNETIVQFNQTDSFINSDFLNIQPKCNVTTTYPFAFLIENNYMIPFLQNTPDSFGTIAIDQSLLQNNVNLQNDTDFIKIEQITDQLKRLHVFGEVFAENGYLVRSDARSKTDIEIIGNALNSVTSLIGKKYSFKTNPDKIKYGFLAQEVQEIIPDLVQKDETGQLSVDYLGVIPYIVEALKTIHENSVSLENSSRNEYCGLSRIVEEAVSQLQVLMEEEGKHIFIEKESRASKILTFDIFGPPVVVLLMAIAFSIFSVAIPFVFPHLVFPFGVVIVETLSLWVAVIAQRKQLNSFFTHGVMHMKWLPSQFFMWMILLTLIHVSFDVSIILGYGGLIISFIYFVIFTVLSVLTCLLYKYKQTRLTTSVALTIFSVTFILSLTASFILFATQPFVSFTILDFEDQAQVNVKKNEPISPLILSKPPWNCISPKIQSDVPLPENLTVTMPSNISPNSLLPTIRGIVSNDIPTTEVKIFIQCSGFIRASYGKIVFKSCETKTDEDSCVTSECGWCLTTNKCGFCDEYASFCDNYGIKGCRLNK